MQTRLSFLTALASKPTHKEKKGQVMTTHPGLTNSKLKRKLPSAAGEESTKRPAKKQKVFTTTPEEMVKIFAQYMQAQGASYGRSVQPARVMASIIERVEHARHVINPMFDASQPDNSITWRGGAGGRRGRRGEGGDNRRAKLVATG